MSISNASAILTMDMLDYQGWQEGPDWTILPGKSNKIFSYRELLTITESRHACGQFDILEESHDTLTINITQTSQEIIAIIRKGFDF